MDISAPGIVGAHFLERKRRGLLYKLVKSESRWDRRIALVATLTFIREKQYEDTFQLAETLIKRGEEEDLVLKAAGWMLKEVGNRDVEELRSFLEGNSRAMHKTMLTYAVEKLSKEERKHWLQA